MLWLIRESCEPVSREVCEPECRLVPKQVVDRQCTKVPQTICTNEEKTVPREVCQPVQRQECQPVSKKECEMQPVEKCKEVSIFSLKKSFDFLTNFFFRSPSLPVKESPRKNVRKSNEWFVKINFRKVTAAAQKDAI